MRKREGSRDASEHSRVLVLSLLPRPKHGRRELLTHEVIPLRDLASGSAVEGNEGARGGQFWALVRPELRDQNSQTSGSKGRVGIVGSSINHSDLHSASIDPHVVKFIHSCHLMGRA